MTKRPPTRKRKPGKAGRPAERLHIPDVQAALDKLLKPLKKAGTAMRRLRDNSML